MILKTTKKTASMTLISRFVLARRLGLLIVVSHVLLALFLLVLASVTRDAHDSETVWELFRISVPLTGAYFASVLYWFTATPGKDEMAATLDQTAAIGIVFVFVAFVIALFAIPLIYVFYRQLSPEMAKNIYTGIELIFGAGIGGMARVLFPQSPEGGNKAGDDVPAE